MQARSELRIYPVDLREYGLTPFGESLYRVVWSDSRQSVAFRADKRLVTPKYQHGAESELQEKWILEKWLSAKQYYGMDAETWDSLQKAAPQKNVYTTEQDRAIDRLLSSLPAEQRTAIESKFISPEHVPVVEPYSHEGEYEFDGVYFRSVVDEGFLRAEIKRHIYRLTNLTTGDRIAEMQAVDDQKEIQNEEKFETLWDETRETAKMEA